MRGSSLAEKGAVTSGESTRDRAFLEMAATDIDERADEDPHHVVEERVAFDRDRRSARTKSVLTSFPLRHLASVRIILPR